MTKGLWTLIDRCSWWMLLGLIVAVTALFGAMYFSLSESDKGRSQHEDGLVPPQGEEVSLGAAMYFSVVTEATLGYGDFRPVGLSRGLICLQVVFGYLMLGLLVAKATSFPGAHQRKVAHAIGGNWIDYIRASDQKTIPNTVGILQVTVTPSGIRVSANNFDRDGNLVQPIVTNLQIEECPRVKCDYTYFETERGSAKSGTAQITFQMAERPWWAGCRATHFVGQGIDFGNLRGYTVSGHRMGADDEAVIFKSGIDERRQRLNDLWTAYFGKGAQGCCAA